MTPLHRRVRSLTDIPLEDLVAQGVQAIVLDLDNTLCDPRGDELPKDAVAFCAKAKALGLRGYILSNGARGRAERLAQALGLPCVSRAKKPLRGAYRRALRELGVQPQEAVAIGDQFLTDALGAISMDMALFLVEPRVRRDKLLVRLARPVDRILRRLLPYA